MTFNYLKITSFIDFQYRSLGVEANSTTNFPLENLWLCTISSVKHKDCYCRHALEWTQALCPLTGARAPVIYRNLCVPLCRPAVEEAQGPTAKWMCWGTEAHIAKGPQIMEEQGVSALNGLLSWGFGCLGQLGKSTDGYLEEAVAKKARVFSDGWTASLGSCRQDGALTLVRSLNHDTAESWPCPHLAMDRTEPNLDLRTDFLTWPASSPWACLMTWTLSWPHLPSSHLPLLGCLGLSPSWPPSRWLHSDAQHCSVSKWMGLMSQLHCTRTHNSAAQTTQHLIPCWDVPLRKYFFYFLFQLSLQVLCTPMS